MQTCVHLTDSPSSLDNYELQSLTGPRGLILYQRMSNASVEENGHLSPHDSEFEMKKIKENFENK